MKLKQLTEWYANYPIQVSFELPESYDARWIYDAVEHMDFKDVEVYSRGNTQTIVLGFKDFDIANDAYDIIARLAKQKDAPIIDAAITNAKLDQRTP